MSTIKDLERNSFHHIVTILAAIGRIFEFTPLDHSSVVKFKTPDGEEKVMCQRGDLCDDPECKHHHLHHNMSQISENYILCPNNLNCCDLDCKYRHTHGCCILMNSFNHHYLQYPYIYQEFIQDLISLFEEEKNAYSDDILLIDKIYHDFIKEMDVMA